MYNALEFPDCSVLKKIYRYQYQKRCTMLIRLFMGGGWANDILQLSSTTNSRNSTKLMRSNFFMLHTTSCAISIKRNIYKKKIYTKRDGTWSDSIETSGIWSTRMRMIRRIYWNPPDFNFNKRIFWNWVFPGLNIVSEVMQPFVRLMTMQWARNSYEPWKILQIFLLLLLCDISHFWLYELFNPAALL